jgi:hypothetical protein
MKISKPIAQAVFFLLGLMLLAPGCVVETREGYYDREHHRWYHEHAWHECDRDDTHCPRR